MNTEFVILASLAVIAFCFLAYKLKKADDATEASIQENVKKIKELEQFNAVKRRKPYSKRYDTSFNSSSDLSSSDW